MAEIGKPVREWQINEPSIPNVPVREDNPLREKEPVKTPVPEKVGV